ncbi:MAG: type II toxin-antitoxin system RelB/DinJ family antitoxin [Pseudomonadales bacterium]|jgi:DNA-damage-inducible protein J|nr:type II toxin-antitoxin system RelB/DinJ family antitoxin [Pseudomonadales bacterium]
MAANPLLQVRVDGKVRDEASAVLAAIGLTVSDAVRLLLKKIAQDKALPFEPLIPNETTIQAMREARAGRVTKAANLDTLLQDLNADA